MSEEENPKWPYRPPETEDEITVAIAWAQRYGYLPDERYEALLRRIEQLEARVNRPVQVELDPETKRNLDKVASY